MMTSNDRQAYAGLRKHGAVTKYCYNNMFMLIEWEQDISMFDWFFTPNNTSSKVIAITIGTIKYCYNNMFMR